MNNQRLFNRPKFSGANWRMHPGPDKEIFHPDNREWNLPLCAGKEGKER